MNSDFKKLITARFFFTLAVQMQSVVLGWRIYEILNSAFSLGMIGLTEAIPALGLALVAGYIVDKSRPLFVFRNLILVSLLSGLLVLFEHLMAQHLPLYSQVLLLYGAAFLTGVARSFSGPSLFAAIPRMVPKNELLQASAKMSSIMQVGRVLGPALGGIIYGFLGSIVASTLVCLSLVVAFVFMLKIKIQINALDRTENTGSVAEELFSGLKFVFRHKVLFPALTLDMVSVFFGGVTALLPIFAKDILFVGAEGLGWLRAAPAVGAALMSFYLSKNANRFRTGRHLLFAVAGFGLSILVFGLSRSFWLSFVALGLSGMFDSVSMVIRSAAVQLSSPDHMRGKIAAVNSIFIGSSNELGEFESGIAAQFLGPIGAVYFGGIVCLLTVFVVSVSSKVLRQMDVAQINQN